MLCLDLLLFDVDRDAERERDDLRVDLELDEDDLEDDDDDFAGVVDRALLPVFSWLANALMMSCIPATVFVKLATCSIKTSLSSCTGGSRGRGPDMEPLASHTITRLVVGGASWEPEASPSW